LKQPAVRCKAANKEPRIRSEPSFDIPDGEAKIEARIKHAADTGLTAANRQRCALKAPMPRLAYQ
jgi:hypothetical protein